MAHCLQVEFLLRCILEHWLIQRAWSGRLKNAEDGGLVESMNLTSTGMPSRTQGDLLFLPLLMTLSSPGSSSWASSLVSADARISSSSPSSSCWRGKPLNQRHSLKMPPKRSSCSPHRTLLKILWMLPRKGRTGRGRTVRGRRVSRRPLPSPLSQRAKWREHGTEEGPDRWDWPDKQCHNRLVTEAFALVIYLNEHIQLCSLE